MTPTQFPSVAVRRAGVASVSREADRTVVWLQGEHDASTADELSQILTEAFALDATDLVLDLDAVEFMGAATVGVILGHRNELHGRSRTLTLRNPSRSARHVLDLCDLLHLVDTTAAQSHGEQGTHALGSWVPLLATERVDTPTDGSRDAAEPHFR